MRPFRLGRWSSPLLPLGTRAPCPQCRAWAYYSSRFASTTTTVAENAPVKRKRGRPRKQPLESNIAPQPNSVQSTMEPPPVGSSIHDSSSLSVESDSPEVATLAEDIPDEASFSLEELPSPPLRRAQESPKLSALHSRLGLPHQLPLRTLMRALIHPTADQSPQFNNASLATLGEHLLGYYMAEYLLVHYPRLPLAVLFAAQQAYIGPDSLASVAQGWGIEVAAEPGGEVDPGLLQFQRAKPGSKSGVVELRDSTNPYTNRKGDIVNWRRGLSGRVVHDDSFGDLQRREGLKPPEKTTLDDAAMQFVRALAGGIYLHAGSATAHTFFKSHIISRRLELASLFTFKEPLRDLSRLCAREGFESPVARLESETGRASRHPVFVVGIYSGRERLGVDAGSSLNEARFKAAVAALKGWYLYSPQVGTPTSDQAILPSETEGAIGGKSFRPAVVDYGEVVA